METGGQNPVLGPIKLQTAPFRSERYFQAWGYSAITRSLLLRSTGSFESSRVDSQIDVHFGGVRLMAIQTVYRGLEIREGEASEVSEVEKRFNTNIGQATLHVVGPGLINFVVSDPMQWHEGTIGPHTSPGVFGMRLS